MQNEVNTMSKKWYSIVYGQYEKCSEMLYSAMVKETVEIWSRIRIRDRITTKS